MRLLSVTLAIGTLLGIALAGPARGQTTIDTTGDPNKTNIIYYGTPETTTYGQTITVPNNGDTNLTDFTFYLDAPSSGQIQSSAYVYAWNGSQATGSALYTSSPFDIVAGSGDNQPITINTGGLNLAAGQQYVLFFSLADPTNYAASTGEDAWVGTSDDSYSGGQFVFLNNSNDMSGWTHDTWSTWSVPDLSFKADFQPGAPLPEASTFLSFGGLLSMGGLAALRRRKMMRA